jgi:hypothetical protein
MNHEHEPHEHLHEIRVFGREVRVVSDLKSAGYISSIPDPVCKARLQGKKPPDRRFLRVLCAKRNKLPAASVHVA